MQEVYFSTFVSLKKRKANKKNTHKVSVFLVQMTGIEPACRKVLDPDSSASANSATPA